MAHIFLNYRGSASLVKPFQESLTRQGHAVYSVGDFDYSEAAALAALHQFDVVIAIWGNDAGASGLFVAIAKAAQQLGKLISVRAPGVQVNALPPEFQQPASLAVSDTHGIALRIKSVPVVPGAKRLPPRKPERAEGIGSAGGRPYPVAPPAAAQAAAPPRPVLRPQLAERARSDDTMAALNGDPAAARDTRKFAAAPRRPTSTDAVEAETGRLVHKIPDKMWVGEPEQVEVRLGRETALGLMDSITGRGALTTADIPIVETMSIMLYSGTGAFAIEAQSETTQLVVNDLVAGTAFAAAEFGRWTWLVTPKKSGPHQLLLKVSAGLKDSRGVPTSVRLPDREFKVAVSVHKGKATARAVTRAVLGFGGALGAAFLGVVTQEFWWPRIKDLMQAWGILG